MCSRDPAGLDLSVAIDGVVSVAGGVVVGKSATRG
jgi:hypothetical protein